MSSPQTVLPRNAAADAGSSTSAQPGARSVLRPLARPFALLILSAIALFGGLPLWLDTIADLEPSVSTGDWGFYRFLIIGGTVGALVLALVVANTWVKLVKQLARTDWD